MNIDSIYSESNPDKLTPFNTVSKPVSKMNKLRSQKNLKSPQHSYKMSIQEIQKQILKQISITEDTMRVFDQNLASLIGKKSINYLIDDHSDNKSTNSLVNIEKLRNLEQSIRRKDQIIKEIDQDIKMLKNGTYYQTKQKNEESNFEKFINEIRQQRQTLMRTQNLLINKAREVNSKKQIIKNVQMKFREKCKKQGTQFISFETFKQNQLKKRKQIKKMEKYRKGSQKKMGSSIKEYPNHTSKQAAQNHNSIHGAADSKRMKDLLNRKNVAETALKTAKKKHILELNDLYGKRDFLLDQNQDLEEKLVSKEHELSMAQKKFSESRGSVSAKKISQRRYKTQRNI